MTDGSILLICTRQPLSPPPLKRKKKKQTNKYFAAIEVYKYMHAYDVGGGGD